MEIVSLFCASLLFTELPANPRNNSRVYEKRELQEDPLCLGVSRLP